MIVGGLEVAEKNLPNLMSWDKAMALDLKDGWRLPTKKELEHLFYLSKQDCIKFGNYGCWSSTPFDTNYVWSLGFYTGNTYINPISNLNYVRLVKEIINIA